MYNSTTVIGKTKETTIKSFLEATKELKERFPKLANSLKKACDEFEDRCSVELKYKRNANLYALEQSSTITTINSIRKLADPIMPIIADLDMVKIYEIIAEGDNNHVFSTVILVAGLAGALTLTVNNIHIAKITSRRIDPKDEYSDVKARHGVTYPVIAEHISSIADSLQYIQDKVDLEGR